MVDTTVAVNIIFFSWFTNNKQIKTIYPNIFNNKIFFVTKSQNIASYSYKNILLTKKNSIEQIYSSNTSENMQIQDILFLYCPCYVIICVRIQLLYSLCECIIISYILTSHHCFDFISV